MSRIDEMLRAALANGASDVPLDMLPYARLLGICLTVQEGGVRLSMPFDPGLIGAPGRLHGGTVGGLLELAGSLAVSVALIGADRPAGAIAKPINISVDYLREGKLETTYAKGTLLRLGRRVANVRAEAWQSEPDRPIAAAHMNVLVAG